MVQNKVAYIGNFCFPDKNASGKRVYANGKLLRAIGYETAFVGVDKELVGLCDLRETKQNYDGFDYYCLPYPIGKKWLQYAKVVKAIEKFLFDEQTGYNPDLVILYGSPTLSIFMTKIIKICKEKNVTILTDCVDWLSVHGNNLVYDIIKSLDTAYRMRYANEKADGVIAISTYLSEYYKHRGKKTVIIPSLNVNQEECVKNYILDTPHVVYAGLWPNPKQVNNRSKLKDRIDISIELMETVKAIGGKFIYDIYGLRKEEYLTLFPDHGSILNLLGEQIVFHGIKSNLEVMKAVKKADYTILIRERTKDTMAGFPTKISESLGCGTPVITTDTSDIWHYITIENGNILVDLKDLDKAAKDIKNKLECRQKKRIVQNPLYYANFKKALSSFLME